MTPRSAILDDDTIAIGPDLGEAAAVAILAHGRGGSPFDMRELAVALANPAIRFIMPAAPGGAWYPERFIAPIASNEPALSRSLAGFNAIVEALLAAGVPAGDIIVGGFSQGACLMAEFVVRHPRRYGAVLILTGGLIGPPGTRWPAQPALQGVPVYLTGSKTDAWVPAARVAETERVFSASGADVRFRMFDERAHAVGAEEIATAGALLAAWSPDKVQHGRDGRRVANDN